MTRPLPRKARTGRAQKTLLALLALATATVPATGPVTGPAWADRAKQVKPLADHFGRGNSCYARTYSPQHLKAHPDQKTLDIRLDHFPAHEGFEDAHGHKLFYPDTPEIVVTLRLRMRGSDSTLTATGFCWPDKTRPDTMSCGLECDAGRFTLTTRGPDRLLLTPTGPLHFGQGCGATRALSPVPDDRSFLIFRQPDATCRPPD